MAQGLVVATRGTRSQFAPGSRPSVRAIRLWSCVTWPELLSGLSHPGARHLDSAMAPAKPPLRVADGSFSSISPVAVWAACKHSLPRRRVASLLGDL